MLRFASKITTRLSFTSIKSKEERGIESSTSTQNDSSVTARRIAQMLILGSKDFDPVTSLEQNGNLPCEEESPIPAQEVASESMLDSDSSDDEDLAESTGKNHNEKWSAKPNLPGEESPAVAYQRVASDSMLHFGSKNKGGLQQAYANTQNAEFGIGHVKMSQQIADKEKRKAFLAQQMQQLTNVNLVATTTPVNLATNVNLGATTTPLNLASESTEEGCPPPPQNPRREGLKQKKTVHFGHGIFDKDGQQVQVTVHPWKAPEASKAWYQTADLKALLDHELNVNLRAGAQLANLKNFTWRGLEHIQHQFNKAEHIQKHVHYVVVFHQQLRKSMTVSSTESSMNDDMAEQLRLVSTPNTKKDHKIAKEIAKDDSACALEDALATAFALFEKNPKISQEMLKSALARPQMTRRKNVPRRVSSHGTLSAAMYY